jgi:ADP-ribose pyrophosphatase YjhB (NUDIX family)
MIQKAIRNIWRRISPTTRARLVRATQDQFTVSTAAIITNESNDILLLNHVLRPLSSWGFPGGFVDHGEEIEMAIRREVREETGIELEDVKLLEINTFKRHIEILWSAKGVGTPEVKSAEIIDLGWFRAEEMPKELGEKQRKQIEAVLKN